MKIKYLAIAIVTTIMFSCQKDDSGPEGSGGSGNVLDNGVMILNEGQFLASNASITLVNDEGEQSDMLFQTVNETSELGDVLQSATETDAAYYLVMNNSAKVEVVNKNNFESTATITGFASPRYMLDLEDGRALVTNFVFVADSTEVDMKIDVVNLNDNTISGGIDVKNWCETMHMKGDKIFVANTGLDQVLVIDKNTLSISNTIATPESPTMILEDKDGLIWVLCIGDSFNGIAAAIVAIDLNTNSIVRRIDYSSGTAPRKIAMNAQRNILFIMTDIVSRTSVGSASAAIAPIPNIEGFSYAYGLGIDPETTDIYVGDAKDFVSKGEVKVYDVNGNLLRTIESGVNPNGFLFR